MNISIDHNAPGKLVGSIFFFLAIFFVYKFIVSLLGEVSYTYLWLTFFSTLVGAFITASLKVAGQYEKAVVLRLGALRSSHSGEMFALVPMVDTILDYVDNRIQSSQFNAESVLTKDTVPVNVDAILFWIAYDAKKAVLEVSDFRKMILQAAQAALRDVIGRSNLSTILSDRETIANSLKKTIGEIVNEWGVELKSVELRDVQIPDALQEAMSREAQAEREKSARVILSKAEVEIAANFRQAAEVYGSHPAAMQLRGMNMLYECMKERGATVIVPSTAVESMGLGTVLATTAAVTGQPLTGNA